MAMFEYQTNSSSSAKSIEAERYYFDPKTEQLIFFDRTGKLIAYFKVAAGAYVRRLG
jgi:hypothetical protein